jgi:hypothetical protein
MGFTYSQRVALVAHSGKLADQFLIEHQNIIIGVHMIGTMRIAQPVQRVLSCTHKK